MAVKNPNSNIQCDRAFYSKLDMYTIIKCNKGYKLVCAYAKYCAKCGHFLLKNSAMMCPYNNKGNYKEYKKEVPSKDCGCKKN